MNREPTPDQAQQLVLQASRRPAVLHRVLSFHSPSAGLGCLARIQTCLPLSFGRERPDGDAVEVALGLTFSGLEALAVPEGYLSLFRRQAAAFAAGAAPRAAARLGDTGESAATHWEPAFDHRRAHALVSLHGDAKRLEDAELVLQLAVQAQDGVECLGDAMGGAHLKAPAGRDAVDGAHWVHFGYRDGLSNPKIRRQDGAGQQITTAAPPDLHEPGELLLGEVRDLGDNPWALPRAPEKVRRFFRHGSFGVLRQVAQHEERFQSAVRRWADDISSASGWRMDDSLRPRVEDFVRAKLCGRWPDGQRVLPEHLPCDRPATPPDLQMPFDFSDDPNGHGCPMGAHIRRMNPRGQGVALSARPRPLFRRGMPYGRWYDGENAAEERGLLGLFFCSDIEDQFEHLLGEWADRMPMGFTGAGQAKDPLIGAHEDARASLVVPQPQQPGVMPGAPWVLRGFTPFVTTLGTLYAFYPSSHALDTLVRSDWLPEDEPWPAR